MHQVRSFTSHSLAALLEAAIIALIVLAFVAAPALAAKASIQVADGAFGGTTTALVNPGGPGTWVFAECLQDGERVYAQYVRVGSTNSATLTLGPTPNWSEGSAQCRAEEGGWGKNGRWRAIASTTFNATD